MEFKDLLLIKKTNVSLKPGDIFALNPKDNVYCFGKIIDTNVISHNSFMNGMNLIYIYDYISNTMDCPTMIERKEIIHVEVVNNQLWEKGFATNIGYSEVTIDDLNKDIAFWDVLKKCYVNINGEKIDHIPKYSAIYGLGSYGSIGKRIQAFISDKNN
ncbi:Imm26 family immunity protein [uncultured Ruminococcus sp.]|uniref:Imm26 family immunity protein n=1 Tax=uncultured Ruminococcus sp. TaxID=165186 RepID=UPI00262F1CE5|nr:Imm26 family immunity protein [uncultured Ruminococcus sp.]